MIYTPRYIQINSVRLEFKQKTKNKQTKKKKNNVAAKRRISFGWRVLGIPHGETRASLENFREESDVATSNASWRAFHGGKCRKTAQALYVDKFNLQARRREIVELPTKSQRDSHTPRVSLSRDRTQASFFKFLQIFFSVNTTELSENKKKTKKHLTTRISRDTRYNFGFAREKRLRAFSKISRVIQRRITYQKNKNAISSGWDCELRGPTISSCSLIREIAGCH